MTMLRKTATPKVTDEFVRQLLHKCLEEPGDFVSKLYRSDQVTQEDTIQQLFANHYRPEKYGFLINTPHSDELRTLNEHIATHSSDFICHAATQHEGPYTNLHAAFCADCSVDGLYCLKGLFSIFHEVLAQYANTMLLNSLSLGDNSEICDTLCTEYTTYVVFLLVLEDQLPALNKLVAQLPSCGLPFSLWKHLHQEFVDLVLVPLLPQFVEGLCAQLKTLRLGALRMPAKHEISCSFEEYERLGKAKTAVTMLANADIDEVSVHFMESALARVGDTCALLLPQLELQTRELYEGYQRANRCGATFKTLLDQDQALLARILTPNLVSTACSDCLKTAQELLLIEETNSEYYNEMQCIRDLEIEKYARKLGLTLP